MLKYCETQVVFREIPNEVTLAINISNCPCNCKGCHSPHLAQDVGEELTFDVLDTLVNRNKGISCVAFMGGDSSPSEINELANHLKATFFTLKVAWYSGRPKLSNEINLKNFDYYKIGPYIEEKGPLSSPTTNQKFYVRGSYTHKMDANSNMFYDMTHWFRGV